MSRLDRALHDVRHHLAAGEVPVVSVLGREVDGRRRRLVVLTEHRLLVAGRRTEALVAFCPDACTVAYDPVGAVLTITDASTTLSLRDVDATAAGLLQDLLRWRRRPAAPAPMTLVATS